MMHELDGNRSRYFPLKRFEVLDRSTGRRDPIYAPERWRGELSNRDMVWIADPHGDYRVQITFDVFPLRRDAVRQRDGLVESIVAGLEEQGLARPVATMREGDRALIEAVSDTGDGFHVFRLFRLWSRDDVYFVGQLGLEYRSRLADRPRTQDLIDLFRPQILRAEPPADLPLVDRLPAPRPGARFNFRDLKTVEPYGFMQLRVPAYWEVEEDDEGHVACFDPDEEALTLFVNYVLIRRFPGSCGELHRKVDMTASEEEDRGVRLRRIKWMVSDSTHDRAMWAIVDLVIDAARADTPEFRDLLGIMNDEVRRMRIGNPPASAEACAEPRRRA